MNEIMILAGFAFLWFALGCFVGFGIAWRQASEEAEKMVNEAIERSSRRTREAEGG